MLPHWIDSTFADGNKTKLDVRSISTHKLTTIRGSLLQFTLIWYSTLRAMKKTMICTNSPRQTPPREHANATTKAYAKPRDWFGKNVRRQQLIISAKLHRKPVLAEGWCLNPSVRPPRRRIQLNRKDASLFFYLLHLKFKWDLKKESFIENSSCLR